MAVLVLLGRVAGIDRTRQVSRGRHGSRRSRSAWRARKLIDATRMYNTRSLVNIIGYLRECDTRCKGIGSRQDQYALLKELIYKILHA